MTPGRCEHGQPPAGWFARYGDAQRRLRRGERQRQYPVCGLWIWEALWPVPPSSAGHGTVTPDRGH